MRRAQTKWKAAPPTAPETDQISSSGRKFSPVDPEETENKSAKKTAGIAAPEMTKAGKLQRPALCKRKVRSATGTKAMAVAKGNTRVAQRPKWPPCPGSLTTSVVPIAATNVPATAAAR